MSHDDEKDVELSKNKLLLLILGVCAFVALGAWMLSLDEALIQSQRRFNNPMLIYGIGLASIICFGVCGVFAVKKLFDKKSGLVFNRSGVIDNSSSISAGLIPWSEVVAVEIFEIHNQKMLVIKVHNPEKYMANGGALKKVIHKASYKMCGSPIAISANALKIDFSELQALFHEYMRKYGHA